VDKNPARDMCPDVGGDWSKANAVIAAISCREDLRVRCCCLSNGKAMIIVGFCEGEEVAVIVKEPARMICDSSSSS
jgi:hypothetical protein